MRVVLSFFVCVFSLAILGASGVYAAENDWRNGVPEVAFLNSTTFHWTPRCSTYYQNVEVENVGEVPVCFFGGDNPKVGITYADNGFIRLIISYPLDDRVYVLEGACGGIANCVYAPSTDTLVSRYYTGPGLSAKAYHQFKERIQRLTDPLTGRVHYTFDESKPDFSFTNADSTPLMVEALAISANGKWLALEYRDMGIMRINLDTFEMRRVWALGFKYGFGNDPTIEMAISNDGKALAVMGERSGFSLTTITPDCGDMIRTTMYGVFDSPDRSCPLASVDLYRLIPLFHGAYDPQFSTSDDRLYFTVVSPSGDARSVGIAKHGTLGLSLVQYLALGDSFTSGEGEVDNAYYAKGTDDTFEKCHLSSRSYPFLFAHLAGFLTAKNVACSGAKIKDISYSSSEYLGQGDRLGSGGLRFPEASLLQLQSETLDTFRPGRIPQEKFVERYHPEVITVGIGGNDAGLMAKLRTCLNPGICEWAHDLYKTAEEIQGLFARLVGLYQQLMRLSPASRLYAMGYPQLIDPEGACDPVTGALLQYDERRFMKEAVMYLNDVIRFAAHRAGIGYVDESSTFQGHELCSGSSTPAMNGLRLGDDMGLGPMLPFRLVGNESFHPTPYGHELVAGVLNEQYEKTQGPMPEGSPSISAYWGDRRGDRRSIAEDFVSPDTVNSDNPEMIVSLPNASLEPNSQVRIEIHSETIRVEGVEVNEKGGLVKTIRLPTGFEEGFHTVHVFGTSYSGELVELYQGIFYGKQDDQASAVVPQSDNSSNATEAAQGMVGPAESRVLGLTMTGQGNKNIGPEQSDSTKKLTAASVVPFIVVVGIGIVGVILLLIRTLRRFRAPEDG